MTTTTKQISPEQALTLSDCEYSGLFTLQEYHVTHLEFNQPEDNDAEYICSAQDNLVCPGGLNSISTCRIINQ